MAEDTLAAQTAGEGEAVADRRDVASGDSRRTSKSVLERAKKHLQSPFRRKSIQGVMTKLHLGKAKDGKQAKEMTASVEPATGGLEQLCPSGPSADQASSRQGAKEETNAVSLLPCAPAARASQRFPLSAQLSMARTLPPSPLAGVSKQAIFDVIPPPAATTTSVPSLNAPFRTISSYRCAYRDAERKTLTQGLLYVTDSFLLFYARHYNIIVKVQIYYVDILGVEEKPELNAILVVTIKQPYLFVNLAQLALAVDTIQEEWLRRSRVPDSDGAKRTMAAGGLDGVQDAPSTSSAKNLGELRRHSTEAGPASKPKKAEFRLQRQRTLPLLRLGPRTAGTEDLQSTSQSSPNNIGSANSHPHECGCISHYPYLLVDITLPTSPPMLLKLLIEDENSFLSIFKESHNIFFLHMDEWTTDHNGCATRQVTLRDPDLTLPTSKNERGMLQAETTLSMMRQTVLRKTADAIVVECKSHKPDSLRARYFYTFLRFCFSRSNPAFGKSAPGSPAASSFVQGLSPTRTSLVPAESTRLIITFGIESIRPSALDDLYEARSLAFFRAVFADLQQSLSFRIKPKIVCIGHEGVRHATLSMSVLDAWDSWLTGWWPCGAISDHLLLATAKAEAGKVAASTSSSPPYRQSDPAQNPLRCHLAARLDGLSLQKPYGGPPCPARR